MVLNPSLVACNCKLQQNLSPIGLDDLKFNRYYQTPGHPQETEVDDTTRCQTLNGCSKLHFKTPLKLDFNSTFEFQSPGG